MKRWIQWTYFSLFWMLRWAFCANSKLGQLGVMLFVILSLLATGADVVMYSQSCCTFCNKILVSQFSNKLKVSDCLNRPEMWIDWISIFVALGSVVFVCFLLMRCQWLFGQHLRWLCVGFRHGTIVFLHGRCCFCGPCKGRRLLDKNPPAWDDSKGYKIFVHVTDNIWCPRQTSQTISLRHFGFSWWC